jgi:hypothetical protein
MCCTVVRQTVRINIVTPTAIHNRQEKGSRNTFHFISCRLGFLIAISVLKLGTELLNVEQLINKLSYVFHLKSERKTLRISKNNTKV